MTDGKASVLETTVRGAFGSLVVAVFAMFRGEPQLVVLAGSTALILLLWAAIFFVFGSG